MSITPLTLNEVFESSYVENPSKLHPEDDVMNKLKLCFLPVAELGLE